MPFIPHTAKDTEEMLEVIGVSSIEDLFDEIPSDLRYGAFEGIPSTADEMTLMKEACKLAALNQNDVCFLGAGAYEHHIPAAVWDITSRGEFLTAYTPYQAEASQGTLQLLFEFQTMIASLTGMDVANASLYDGATAAAEAVLMASRLKRDQNHHKVIVPASLHPHYKDTLKTILSNQQIEIIPLDIDPEQGITPLQALAPFASQDITALIIPMPNFFGCIEHVDELTDFAKENQIISIAVVNPIALGIIKPPGEWGREGVDIVCGEGQPLGCPLASGGPYFGFFSTKIEHVRQIPGRIVGQTVDLDGKTGFTLTLQAREQHIRRAKATSNICTNQGLLVTAATIHMSLLGPEGIARVANTCHHRLHHLKNRLTTLPNVHARFNAPHFHEAVIQLPINADEALKALADHNILGGLHLEPFYPSLKNCILICATEMRTDEDIELYFNALRDILS